MDSASPIVSMIGKKVARGSRTSIYVYFCRITVSLLLTLVNYLPDSATDLRVGETLRVELN